MYAVAVQSPRTTDYGSLSGAIFLCGDATDTTDEATLLTLRLLFQQWLPYGVTSIARPHSTAHYNGRTYILGCYNYNVVIDEHHRVWKQGIRPPVSPPSISGASGTGNFAYLSWWDEYTGERSSLSPGLEIGSGTPRTWGSLPTRPPDDTFSSEGTFTWNGTYSMLEADSPAARSFYIRPGDRIWFETDAAMGQISEVLGNYLFQGASPLSTQRATILPAPRPTHLELWLSVAGGSPRLVMRVPQGTASVVESTAVGLLGETFLTNFERFPRCTVNTIYHDRQIMAGNADAPDTVYLSELFYPERWSGLSFRTRNGEPVVSLLGTKDYCLVLTPTSSYVLQGYTENDLTLTVADPNIGAITHAGNSVVHGVPYVWTQNGPFLYNGSWHPISPENRHYLRESVSGASPAFEFWNGTNDPTWNSWMTGGRFVLDYSTVQPEAGGGMGTARLSEDSLIGTTVPPYVIGTGWEHLTHFMAPYGGGEGALFCAIDPMGNFNVGGSGVYAADFSFWVMRMGSGIYPSMNLLWMYEGDEVYESAAYVHLPLKWMVVLGHNMVGGDGGPREAKVFKKIWQHIVAEGGITRVLQTNANPSVSSSVQIYLMSGEEYDYWSGSSTLLYGTNLTNAMWYIKEPGPDPPFEMARTFRGSHFPHISHFLSGRGLTTAITGDRISGRIRYMGYGGYWVPGPQMEYAITPPPPEEPEP